MKSKILIALLMISNSLCAMTEITGFISTKDHFSLTSFEVPSPTKDPILQAEKHSDFSSLVVLKLKNVKNDKANLDLKKYNAALVRASFDLVSYDQKTGSFTYQLSLNPKVSFIGGIPAELGEHKNYDGQVYFEQTRTPDLIIKGRIKDNKITVLNNDSISLKQLDGSIIFNLRKEIPVILVLNQ